MIVQLCFGQDGLGEESSSANIATPFFVYSAELDLGVVVFCSGSERRCVSVKCGLKLN